MLLAGWEVRVRRKKTFTEVLKMQLETAGLSRQITCFFSLSQLSFLILSLPFAQNRRASQMQSTL